MPDADGRIPPVRVPTVPWIEVFDPGERVRIVDHASTLVGREGEVVAMKDGNRAVLVRPDDQPFNFRFAPGQLRRVS